MPNLTVSYASYNASTRSWIRSHATHLRWQYRSFQSCITYVIFGIGILKKQHASIRCVITPTANYRTGIAGIQHGDLHSPIEMASSCKRTWRWSNTCTPRTAKLHTRKWGQMHLQMNQKATSPSYNAELDPDSKPQRSWFKAFMIPPYLQLSRDKQLLVEFNFKTKPNQPI